MAYLIAKTYEIPSYDFTAAGIQFLEHNQSPIMVNLNEVVFNQVQLETKEG